MRAEVGILAVQESIEVALQGRARLIAQIAIACERLLHASFRHVGGVGDRPPGVAGFSGCSHGGVAVVESLALGYDCLRDFVE